MKGFLRITLLFTLLASLSVSFALAQEHTVSGAVTDVEAGTPLPGVNVVVKGTATGTATGADGQYALGVSSPQDTLVFSFIGYEAKEVPIDGRTMIDVALAPSVLQGEEVVVTALGIEQQARSLGYSVAQVESADIVQASAPSLATALYGKVPGLNISQNASGGGVNLTIRGVRSITGSSRPLIVVDGIPIRDRNSGYSTVGWEYNRDLGTPLGDINPQDIESVSVLKGAAAAALYGSEAANGVILITTKTGVGALQDGLGVEFTSATDFTTTMGLLNFQNQYGAGRGSTFEENEEGVLVLPGGFESVVSWGPEMNGQDVLWWDGTVRPYSPQPDNYYNMFRTGMSSANTIAVSKAAEDVRYRLSYTRNDARSIVPGATREANNFSLGADLSLSPRLTTQVHLNYYNRLRHNPPPKLYVAFNMPRSQKTNLLEEYYKMPGGYSVSWALQQGQFERMYSRTEELMNLFYWKQLEQSYDYQTDHLIGSLELAYEIADGVNFRVQAGTDFSTNEIEQKDPSTQPAQAGPSGFYGMTKKQNRITYGEAMLTLNQPLTDDIGVEVMAGAAFKRLYLEHSYVGTSGGLVQENWFSTTNSANQQATESWRASEATDGLFGSLRFSFRDYLFLTATGRNDWTSTLPPGNNSYFYPSVLMSFVFSDAFDLPAYLAYGKVYANYAFVGHGANRYQANNVYTFGNWEGINYSGFDSVVPPLSLQPEQQRSIGLGLNLAFFDHRLGLDLTYYNQRNVDQIINLDVAHSSGATALTINSGTMVNQGLEVQLRATPVMTGDFQWNTVFNFAKNWNRIEELAAGLERLVHSQIDGEIFIESHAGGEYGGIYGYDYQYAPDGRRIVGSDGLYAKSDSLTHAGNILPDWTGGFINTFRYKNFSLTGVIDVRVGGDIISMTNYWGYYTGKWRETLRGRDAEHGGIPYWVDEEGNYHRLPGHDAEAPNGSEVFHDGVILEGVQAVINDAGEVVGYEPNEQVVPVDDYYISNYAWKGQGIYPEAVYDNSYVKLREVALSYQVPGHWIAGTPLQDLSLSLIGRNLMYLFKNVPNIDPESAIGSSAALQGYEYMTWPSTRSFGFRIHAAF